MSIRRYRPRSWISIFFGKIKSGERKDSEETWGQHSEPESAPRRTLIAAAVPTVIGAGLLVVLYLVVSNHSGNTVTTLSPARPDQAIGGQIDGVKKMPEELAEEVALAFLAETDPQQRLQWVRNRDQVRQHMGHWPGTVLHENGGIDRLLGHSDDGNCRRTCFVVKLRDGELRMLEVVDTGDGPRVDWDAYARHCSADWPAIIEGRVERADVRIYASPGDYYEQPFADENEWTCFQLTSPDMPDRVHAYARKGTVREARMKAIILGNSGFRQHMMLRLVRHEGPDSEPLFEIERTLAIGWVRGEKDVEADWESAD